MIRLEVETKNPSEKAMQHLKAFFGSGGLGLDIVEETEGQIRFEGGGGYVGAVVCSAGKKSRIELVSREWEQQVKKFAAEVK